VKQAYTYLEKELLPQLKGTGYSDLAHKISKDILGKDLGSLSKLPQDEKEILWTNIENYVKKASQTGKSNPVTPMAIAELVSNLSGVEEALKQSKKYEIRSGAYCPSR